MVCFDVADAFVSVQLCLSGSQCSYGLQALAPAFCSISGVCQATVAQYAAAATAGGCPVPFSPSVSSSSLISELCTASCVDIRGCTCSDLPDAFSSVQLCTGGGAQCAHGLQSLSPAFGSLLGVCQATVAQYAAAATAAGCPAPFSPPVSSSALISDLCTASCASAGVNVSICALPPTPQAPPAPPALPPLPPLAPGPSDFLTFATLAQLRVAIEDAPPSANLSVYIHQGTVFALDGAPLVVGAINLQLV